MGTGGAWRGLTAARRAALLAVAGLVALGAAGCGSEDFPNEPRAPSPIEVTAKVNKHEVVVSPDKFGAGPVVFTVANLTDSQVSFTVDGPTSASSNYINGGSVAYLKVNLEKGRYQAKADGDSSAKPAVITVGPERETAQNDVLLP